MPRYRVIEEVPHCLVTRTLIVEAESEKEAVDSSSRTIVAAHTKISEGSIKYNNNAKEILGPVVPAECHSDDWKRLNTFDAALWLSQAQDKEILDLARCGWRGDQPSDAVALFMADYSDKLARLFKYVEATDDVGFECSVDPEQARKWLEKNKPELHKQVLEIEEGK